MDDDVYYVERNAGTPVRVMRPVSVGSGSRIPPAAPPAAAPGYVAPPAYAPAPVYPPAQVYQPVPGFTPNALFGQSPIYAQPPAYWGGPWGANHWGNTTLGALFGGVNMGQLIDLVGQGFAAIRSLPAAPVSSGDIPTDVTNLITYQQALAEHGKLDEQIRTGVHIIAKLLGA